MIYILTGAIRTGKTNALLDWIKDKNDVDGLLCPDDDLGKRYFLKVAKKEMFPLEIQTEDDVESKNIITIGPFQFLKSAFHAANDYLLRSNEENTFSYLIIDELGKLELKNEGLHDSSNKLIPQYVMNESSHLILVVRESLIEDIVRHYGINDYQLLKKENLRENRFA